MSRPRQLADWQWARIARILRLRARLTDKQLARRWGVDYQAIRYAARVIRQGGKP